MRRLILTLCICIVALTTDAQLLWKISGNGIKEPSYIFGTHHVAPNSITDSIKGFDKAFESTRQLYGEIDMNFMTDNSTLIEMQKAMTMPDGKRLSDLFSNEDRKLIDSACKKYLGIGIDMMDMLKPMAIASQLSVVMSMKEFPELQKGEQLDMNLQNMAKKEGKEVKGLESLEFQTNLIFNMPLEEQAEFLLKTVESTDESEKTSKELANAYKSQNLDKIMELINKEEMQDNENYIKMLVYDRNRNWVEQMKSIVNDKPTFFVVGAGHLPGEEGVLKLLENEGYTIEPVM